MHLLCLIKFYANIGIASLAISLSSAYASPVEDAGEVTFSLGKAFLNGDELIKVGSKIHEGDVIETLGNGHVHIRFADNGLVSVRPDSRLSIEHYSYDPKKPSDSVIKFNLNEGVMRSISGTGAKAARDKFRLNTPIAAIGVRGTDFVVKASNDLVQAIVNEGAIVVAPFSNSCNAGSVGPCSDSVELNSTAQQLLELSSLNESPRLIPLSAVFSSTMLQKNNDVTNQESDDTDDKKKSDKAEPDIKEDADEANDIDTHPDQLNDQDHSIINGDQLTSDEETSPKAESEQSTEKEAEAIMASSISTNNQTKASSTSKLSDQYSSLFTQDMPDDEVKSLVADILTKKALQDANPTKKLAWGRYLELADGVIASDTIIDDYSNVIESGLSSPSAALRREFNEKPIYTILLRAESEDRAVIDKSLGSVDFKLADSQANVYLSGGGTEKMSISNEFLSINFSTGKFKTGLTLDSKSTSVVDFNASGKILETGKFQIDDTSALSGSFDGSTTLDGDAAGYMFYKDVNVGVIEGATIWHK